MEDEKFIEVTCPKCKKKIKIEWYYDDDWDEHELRWRHNQCFYELRDWIFQVLKAVA